MVVNHKEVRMQFRYNAPNDTTVIVKDKLELTKVIKKNGSRFPFEEIFNQMNFRYAGFDKSSGWYTYQVCIGDIIVGISDNKF